MLEQAPFLCTGMVESVLEEFEWPEKLTVSDEMPDGILVSFPKCRLFFSEDSDGQIHVHFPPSVTNVQLSLELAHAMAVFVPFRDRVNGVATPGLIKNDWPFPTEEKSRNGLRNICKVIFIHMRHVVEGDFSWVNTYIRMRDAGEL